MSDLIRLTDAYFGTDEDCEAPIWGAVEDAVARKFNVKPFDPITDVGHRGFRYVHSKRRRERFSVLANHHRFRSSIELVEQAHAGIDAPGPIEADILRFIKLPYPDLCLLIGGMGGGKSTTLRYLLRTHATDISATYCDLDPLIDATVDAPDTAARILSKCLSPSISHLIPPSDEFTKVWTWGMSVTDDRPHHAKYVLSVAQTMLRRELEGEWLAESPRAIEIRKKCHETIFATATEYVTYLGLLVDYYLTITCRGERGHFLLVIDNVDPLPPKLQRELLDCACRLQESAQCKVLLAMRPLTYSKNFQAANRTIDVIEHFGPGAIDLIETRIRTLVDTADLSAVRVRLKMEDGEETEIAEPEIRYWINQVIAAACRTGRPSTTGESTAKDFIEGICNNSLRSALIVAPKLFTSAVVPFVLPPDGGTQRTATHPRIRSHDLVRAVLIGRKSCFRAHRGRIVDNIFDLGKQAAHHSLTCKLRLLKYLDKTDNGLHHISKLRDHLAMFDIPDEIILEGLNAIILQSKRLAWSDSVVLYESFSDAPLSKIQIADGGRFYVNHAIQNLEYVQEVHLDSPLPTNVAFQNYQNGKFADRITSLRYFLRNLHEIDRREVTHALAQQRGLEYFKVYGSQLFSSAITTALARQVLSIGRSMLGGSVGRKFHTDIDEALQPWQGLDSLLEHEDREIVAKLATYA